MERCEVLYNGRTVGTVMMYEEAGGVRFDAVCTLSGERVLRLYAGRAGRTVRIGVLTPHEGRWHIGRTLSRQALREAGLGDALPNTFWLTDHTAAPEPTTPQTGDPLLDRLLHTGAAALMQDEDGTLLTCPFDPARPSPLAFALTACTVREGRAILPHSAWGA